MNRGKIKYTKQRFVDEDTEWLRLTPAERFSETTKLWKRKKTVLFKTATLSMSLVCETSFKAKKLSAIKIGLC